MLPFSEAFPNLPNGNLIPYFLSPFSALFFQVLFLKFIHLDLKRIGYEQYDFWFIHKMLTMICISENIAESENLI